MHVGEIQRHIGRLADRDHVGGVGCLDALLAVADRVAEAFARCGQAGRGP